MLNSKTVTFCEKVYIPLKGEIVFTPPFKIHCRYAYFSACKIQLLRWYNIASYNHTIFSCYNHSFALHDHGDHAFVCQLCCNSCSTVRRYICWYRETASKGGQLARLKSLNYALIFPENILLTLFFISMNTIFTYFRICENSYK